MLDGDRHITHHHTLPHASRIFLHAVDLAPGSQARLDDASARHRLDEGMEWTPVFATSGPITAEQRASVRMELLWQGYGMVAPSVFAHPAVDSESLNEILQRVDVKGSVFVCRASEAEPPPARPLSELIGQCWELGSVIEDYREFHGYFIWPSERPFR